MGGGGKVLNFIKIILIVNEANIVGRKPDLKKVQCFEPTLALYAEVEFLVHYMYIYTMLTFRECSSLVLCSCSFTDAS